MVVVGAIIITVTDPTSRETTDIRQRQNRSQISSDAKNTVQNVEESLLIEYICWHITDLNMRVSSILVISVIFCYHNCFFPVLRNTFFYPALPLKLFVWYPCGSSLESKYLRDWDSLNIPKLPMFFPLGARETYLCALKLNNS